MGKNSKEDGLSTQLWPTIIHSFSWLLPYQISSLTTTPVSHTFILFQSFTHLHT